MTEASPPPLRRSSDLTMVQTCALPIFDEIRAKFSAENVEDDRGVSITFTPEQRAFFTQAGFAVAKEGLVWRRDYP